MTASDLVEAAQVAHVAKRFPEAIEKARAALLLEPGNERARFVLAQALDKSSQEIEAAAIVEQLILEGPERPDFYHWRAVLLGRAGRPQEALPVAERFVQLRPDSSDAHGHLGVLFAALGRTEEAAASFETAVQLDPNSPPIRYNLGLALIQLGNDSGAEPVLSELLEITPGFGPGHFTLGELYLRKGAHSEAITQARHAVAAEPENLNAHYLLVRALTERAAIGGTGSDEAEAERHIRLALALEPDSFLPHAMLGFALQEKGRFEEAFPEFETSLRLNPAQGATYYGLATCRKFTEADTGYVDLVASALTAEGLSPVDYAYVHYALGKILEDQKQFEAAISEFDAANKFMFEWWSPVRPFDAYQHEDRASWVIETFTPEFLRRERGGGSSSDVPLLVVGMIRSGTTLIEQILSSHTEVAGAGELIFWHENAKRANPGGLAKLDPNAVSAIASDYLSMLRGVGPSALRVTDKLPENFLYLGLIHAIFPEARIIHCRRHPVDTCLSIYATPYTSPADFVFNRRNIVTAYRQYLRLMAHWRRVIPSDRLLEVDYEEVVADREAASRRMVEFAGLDWDEACLHHERNDRPVKTLSRWQVRQPIYGTSVARWKNFEPWLGEFAELLH